jgi:hypothetical protein
MMKSRWDSAKPRFARFKATRIFSGLVDQLHFSGEVNKKNNCTDSKMAFCHE